MRDRSKAREKFRRQRAHRWEAKVEQVSASLAPWEAGTPADVVADICKDVRRRFGVKWLLKTEPLGRDKNGLIRAWYLVDATLIMKYSNKQQRYVISEIHPRKEKVTA
jgi:hypothetical protein